MAICKVRSMKYNKLTTSDIENLRGMIADPDRFVTEVTEHWDHDQLKTVRAMPELVIRPTKKFNKWSSTPATTSCLWCPAAIQLA